jgi:hypothetical protein
MRWLWLLPLLFVVACDKPVSATHKVLQWDSNVEADMKEYRVYACAATPCLGSGTPFATVVHSASVPTHQVAIPDLTQFYVVYAVDQSGNVSAPSVTVTADLTAPAVVKNPRIV